MRRLSLILSDLYVPEEAARSLPHAIGLPAFDWLLRFARSPVACPDWRAWVAAQAGLAELARMPVAQVAARAFVDPALAAAAWMATPVHLEARLDHVRLVDRGLMRIDGDEGMRWCAAFARDFGPDVKLHPAGERGFLLTGVPAAGVASVDPARLLDSDVAHSLPRGPGAGELRRLGAELEIWLHSMPLNVERETSGRRRISAFWFWGGTHAPETPAPWGEITRETSSPTAFAVHGDDPWLAGLASTSQATFSARTPAGFQALDPSVEHHVVELSPMSDPRTSLADTDADWFGPARTALSDGKLAALDVVANDQWFRIDARAGWKVWRRKRDWLAAISRPASSQA